MEAILKISGYYDLMTSNVLEIIMEVPAMGTIDVSERSLAEKL
jgi:hypothetical protein